MAQTTTANKNRKKRKRRFKAGKNKGLLPHRRHRSITSQIIQIIVVVAALFIYKQFRTSSPANCDESKPMCPDKYFSDTYASARQKFLSISSTIEDAKTYNLPIYALDDGNYLHTDVTIINPNSKSDHLIIHLSGTHGVEGHAGSAIQLSLLEYISNTSNNGPISPLFANYSFEISKDESPIIIFVHSLNPFGFHFSRRNNENNVDINRNYKTDKEWKEFSAKGKESSMYEQMNDLFNPIYDLEYVAQMSEKLPSSKFIRGLYTAWCYWSMFIKGTYYYFKIGYADISKAVVTGQWWDENGIQYNGKPFKMEKSHSVLKEFIEQRVFDELHSEWKTQIKKLSFLDIHTGLGKYGLDTLICENIESVDKIKALMPVHVKKNLIVDADNTLDGAYDNVNGFTFAHIDSMMNSEFDGHDVDVLGVTQEFGTYPFYQVFAGMRLENAFTFAQKKYLEERGQSAQLMDKVTDLVNMSRRRYKALFYVERVDWKTEIVTRGFDLFNAIFRR